MTREKANSKKEEGREMENGDMGILLQRSQSSVVVKNDGKGKLSYEIKVYADNIGEAVEAMKSARHDVEKQLGMDQ